LKDIFCCRVFIRYIDFRARNVYRAAVWPFFSRSYFSIDRPVFECGVPDVLSFFESGEVAWGVGLGFERDV